LAYTVLSHTDLSRESGKVDGIDLATLNWGNYDLIVIDESHNFRNNTKGKRDEDGNIIRKSRYERLMEDIIQTGVKTKVLLLSATPVNNDLKDLRNQIYFVTEGRRCRVLAEFRHPQHQRYADDAQKTFMEWAKRAGEKDARDLMEPALGRILHPARRTDHCPFAQAHPEVLQSIAGADRPVSPSARSRSPYSPRSTEGALPFL
jgi:SNF2 family DNA or RNA helicase